ncbi:MAG: hypothetical protein IPM06_18630 [Rhizobiales bacterium]|nr:hypothetical protein [Hyphomicrobiales bacterium]
MDNVNGGFGGFMKKYSSWDFLNSPKAKSADGTVATPGSGAGDLTTVQKIGRGGQMANTFLRDLFSESDARAQRKRELEEQNARLAESFRSQLPALVKVRQDLANRTAALSSLSRMF